jgi:hypothetical protein
MVGRVVERGWTMVERGMVGDEKKGWFEVVSRKD